MFPTQYFPVPFFAGQYWPPGGTGGTVQLGEVTFTGVATLTPTAVRTLFGEVEFYCQSKKIFRPVYTAGGALEVTVTATYYADPTDVPEVDFQSFSTYEASPSVTREGECVLTTLSSVEFAGRLSSRGSVNFQCGSDLVIGTAVEYACGVEYVCTAFYKAIPISVNPIVIRRNFARYRTQLATKQEVEHFKDVDP